MFTIAKYEGIQLLRDPLVLLMSTLIPLAACGFIYWSLGSANIALAAVFVPFFMGSFVIYGSSVTTLAARRQNLFLKRLRCTSESSAGIVIGLILTFILLAAAETIGTITVFSILQTPPSNFFLFIVAVTLVLALYVGFGLATAGVTKSPDSAQVTTLPVALGVMGVAFWVAVSGTETLTLLKLALPGGAAAELLLGAWQGTQWQEAAIPLIVTVAWTAIAFVASKFFFKWEPRR